MVETGLLGSIYPDVFWLLLYFDLLPSMQFVLCLQVNRALIGQWKIQNQFKSIEQMRVVSSRDCYFYFDSVTNRTKMNIGHPIDSVGMRHIDDCP